MPDGVTIIQAQSIVQRLCVETDELAFELLDVAPYWDISYQTASTANYVMHSCSTGIAFRK